MSISNKNIKFYDAPYVNGVRNLIISYDIDGVSETSTFKMIKTECGFKLIKNQCLKEKKLNAIPNSIQLLIDKKIYTTNDSNLKLIV